jgi:hypothetical protein
MRRTSAKARPGAWIRFDEQVAEGAKDLRPGEEIVVLTWLHLSPRDELSTHPQDDMSQPLTGVFSTCSPTGRTPSACTVPASWRATGFGLNSTLWRQSTGRRWWTSNRPYDPPALPAPGSALRRPAWGGAAAGVLTDKTGLTGGLSRR